MPNPVESLRDRTSLSLAQAKPQNPATGDPYQDLASASPTSPRPAQDSYPPARAPTLTIPRARRVWRLPALPALPALFGGRVCVFVWLFTTSVVSDSLRAT